MTQVSTLPVSRKRLPCKSCLFFILRFTHPTQPASDCRTHLLSCPPATSTSVVYGSKHKKAFFIDQPFIRELSRWKLAFANKALNSLRVYSQNFRGLQHIKVVLKNRYHSKPTLSYHCCTTAIILPQNHLICLFWKDKKN